MENWSQQSILGEDIKINPKVKCDLYFGDNLTVMKSMDSESIDFCYTDPPYNTGKTQIISGKSYEDKHGTTEEYLEFLKPRIKQIYRLLKHNASFVIHIDYRVSHHIRLMIDNIFNSECINEIIWAYDFGGRKKDRLPEKHDNLYWYCKGDKWIFNRDEVEKIPYMAPGMQENNHVAMQGKYITDVWWHTIVGTQSKERVGYPNQKPLGIINRLVKLMTNPGHTLLDCFAGSGTLGKSALSLNRNSILIDQNIESIKSIKERLSGFNLNCFDQRI